MIKTIRLKSLEQVKYEFGVRSDYSDCVTLSVKGMPNIVGEMYRFFGNEINVKNFERSSVKFDYDGWMFDKRWIDYSLGNEVKKMFDELIKDL